MAELSRLERLQRSNSGEATSCSCGGESSSTQARGSGGLSGKGTAQERILTLRKRKEIM